MVADVSAVAVPADDADKQLSVMEGAAIVLPCPLYQPSLPVRITWLYADTYIYEPVSYDETKALTDNGTDYWFTSERVTTILVSHQLQYIHGRHAFVTNTVS